MVDTNIVDVGEYVFGLGTESQHDKATVCEECGQKAVLFNPGNVVVQCHACGTQPPGDYIHAEMRQRHLLNYVIAAARQLPKEVVDG